MHPVSRLTRVIQQLRSFGELHASELETLALDFDLAGQGEAGARLRLYRDLQRDEAQLVVDELVDIQSVLYAAEASAAPEPPDAGPLADPAINSPRRARWLAEQAAEAERLKQPFSRRDLFGRAAPRADVQ